MRPRVLIVGCGALGTCLAALLSAAADVTVFDRGAAVGTMVRRRGIVLKEGQRVTRAGVSAVELLQGLAGQSFDLVIIATKAMAARAAAKEAGRWVRARRVFFPQNGLFDISWAGGFFKGADICRGVTTLACRETGAGLAELAFRGKVFTGGAGARWVAALFTRAGVKASAVRDPRRAVWAKLVFNAVMNPVPVITGRGYAILKTDDRIYDLVRRAVIEGKYLAAAEGVRLAFDPLRVVEGIRAGRYGTLRHMGSTYNDVVSGKPTEMRFMTDALLAVARRHQISVPALKEIRAAFAGKAKDLK